MTFAEFKDELFRIKRNRELIRLFQKKLEILPQTTLETLFSGAIDYSKDRVQNSLDPDGKVISRLQAAEEEYKKTVEDIKKLEEDNAEIEKFVFSVSTEDIGGALVRSYFIDGIPIKQLAVLSNYAESYCYQLWRMKISEMYERWCQQNE